MSIVGKSISVSKHNLYKSDNQPRRHIAAEVIEERRTQLESEGQLSPLLVFPADAEGKHEIVDGECRWRAALDSDTFDELRVEEYLGDCNDVASLLVTQLLRNDDGSKPLTALEKSQSYQRIVSLMVDDDEKGSAFKQAADRLGIEYTEFTRALKVGEMEEHISNFVLKQGIDDKRVINGLMRVDREGKKDDINVLMDDIRANDVKKIKQEATQTTREIVTGACKSLKGDKTKKGAKEKLKRNLSARKIDFTTKGDELYMRIETPREIITFEIDAEISDKFRELEMTEV